LSPVRKQIVISSRSDAALDLRLRFLAPKDRGIHDLLAPAIPVKFLSLAEAACRHHHGDRMGTQNTHAMPAKIAAADR
jgi:hypothetical protein